MKKPNYGAVYLLGSAVLWSTAGTLSKYIPWNALSISCIRGVISALVCFFAMGRQKITINRVKIVTAVCYLGESLLFIYANKLTTAGSAIMLQNTSPIFIIGFSFLFYRRKPSALDAATTALLIFGIALTFLGSFGGQTLGNVLAILSGVFYAGIFFSSALPGANVLQSIILGNAMYVVLSPLLLLDRSFMHPTKEAWIAALFMGVFQLGLSWVFFSKGIKTTAPLAANFITMVEPVLSPIWAFLFLKEELGRYAILGAVMVIGSITVYNWLSLRKKERTAE